MLKLKIGDNVKVIAGKDKGRDGQIEVLDRTKRTVVLPGINIYKRHIKAALAADKKGGIFEIPRALPFSKVALICPHCKKTTRVGIRVEGEQKVRFCKKCDRTITASSEKPKQIKEIKKNKNK